MRKTESNGSRITTPAEGNRPREVVSGTRVTIELEARYQRGRGSVDEYLNRPRLPIHTSRLHYLDPEGTHRRIAARPTGCRVNRRRSSRIRTASNWAGW